MTTVSYPAMSAKTTRLEDLIEKLVALDSSPAPVISCYVDLRHSLADQIADLQRRAAIARSGLRGQARFDFDDALGEIVSQAALEATRDFGGSVKLTAVRS